MKKIISLLLVCMMMLSMVTVVSAEEVTVATIFTLQNVDLSEQTDATQVEVPIVISGIPEGKSYYVVQFYFEYDATKLTFKQNYPDVTYEGGSAYYGNYVIPSMWGSGENEVTDGVGKNNFMYTASMGDGFKSTALGPQETIVSLPFDIIEGSTGKASVKLTDVKVTEGSTGEDVDYQLSTGYTQINDGAYVTLTKTYAVTSTNAAISGAGTDEEPYVYGGKVDITSNTGAKVDELDGDETVTVAVSEVVPGYKAIVKKDGVAMTGVDTADGYGNYTFTMEGKDVNIDVTYEKRTYNIKYPETKPDGVANWGTVTSAEYGATVTINPTTTSGKYAWTSVKAGETELVTDGVIGSFTMPASDVEITVADLAFTADQVSVSAAPLDSTIVAADAYEVTVTAIGEDTTEKSLPVQVSEKKTVTFEVYQKAGYEVVSVASDETTISEIEEIDEYTKEYTFTVAEESKDIVIDIDVNKIVYNITDGAQSLINSKPLTDLGHSIDFVSYQTTASVGDTVKFKVTPKNGMSITGVTATFSDGSKKACDLVQSMLFSVGGEYTFEYPADGIVILSVTETSADVSLKSITVKTEAGDEYPVTLTAPYSYRLPAYYNGKVTVEAEANNGDATVVVDPAAGVDITAGPSGKTYTITVTADDEVGGKATTATYNVNVINPFDTSAANLFLEDDIDAVTKGAKYSVAVKAMGIPAGATWVGFEVQLPKDIIAQYNDAVKFEIGSGVTADNPTTDITYNYKDGLVTAKILNGDGSKDFGLNADNETELLTISFDVVEDTKATTFDVVATTANYSLDTSVNAVPFTSIGKIENIPIVEEGASQADVYKALAYGLYNEEDYTEQDWFDVREAIKTAVEAIDAAANDPGTGNAATDAANAENAMKTAIQTLKDTVGNYTDEKDVNDPNDDVYVNPVIQTLEQYKDHIKGLVTADATDFTTNNKYDSSKTEIQDVVDRYNTDTTGLIDANTSRDEELLKLLVADAKAEMDAVKTMAEYQSDANKEIDAIDTSIYTDESKATLATKKATAQTAIKEATTAQAVADAVKTYKDAFAAAKLITTDREASNKEVDDYIADAANGIVAENYSPSNWNKILIEEIRGELKISDATSEAKMDKIVEDTIKAIGDVLTLAEEESAALKAINDATEISDIDIDLIQATGVDNIDSSKEELYKAAIWEATQGGTVDIKDKNANGSALDEFQTIINNANALEIQIGTDGKLLRGDFNCSGKVDGSDAAGAMKYLCGVDLGWVPTAQGIVNADLCTPGDGVLTVYDVVQIIKEINL